MRILDTLRRFIQERPWWAACISIAVLILLFAYLVLWAPNTTSVASARAVAIPRGATFKSVGDSLEASGILQSRWSFNLAGRILGLTRDLKVGKYLFAQGLSNASILRDIAEGKSRIFISVSIPEGWRLERSAIRFSRLLGTDTERFIELCQSRRFARSSGIGYSSA